MPVTKQHAARAVADEQETSSHIGVHPLYTPADLEGWDYDRDLTLPDSFPTLAARRPPCTAAASGPCGWDRWR